VVHRGVQQILGEQNLDVNQPFLVVVRHFPEELTDVVVDEEPLHQLKMDYFLVEVDEEPLHQLKMDYFLDVVLTVLVQMVSRHFLLRALPPRALQLPLYLLAPLLVPALTLQYLRQVLRQVQLLVQRLLHPLALQRPSLLQPS
jgi:hypothetical protein